MLPPLDPINLLESSMAEDASPRTQNLKKVAEWQPGPINILEYWIVDRGLKTGKCLHLVKSNLLRLQILEND